MSEQPITGLYQKHRPTRLKDVVGQAAAVKGIAGLLQGSTFPRALLFTGPSGCGKTTLARILAAKLNCDLTTDFFERNCADFRGIDSIREIRQRLGLRPSAGSDYRIWLIDEAHQLTADAQDASLKMLEDAPPHVLFFLCTTHPKKLRPTILTRCTEIMVRSLQVPDLQALVEGVAKKEGRELGKEVAQAIALRSEGSARTALNLLEKVLHLDDEGALQTIDRTRLDTEAEFLGRLLIYGRPEWAEVAAALRAVEDHEGMRHGILGYAQAVLIGGKAADSKWKPPAPGVCAKAALVLRVFKYPLYDCGRPGLADMCWQVFTAK